MLRISRKTSVLMIFLAVITVILFTYPALASPINTAEDELESINNQIEENQQKTEEVKRKESNLLKEISDVDGKLRVSEDELVELNDQLNETVNKCEEVEGELDITQKELQKIERELEELEREVDRQKNVLDDRLINAYKQGELIYLEVVLDANDFSDLLNRLFFISLIANQDAALLSNIELTKKETDAKKLKVKEHKDEITEKRNVLDKEEVRLKSLKSTEELKEKEIQSERDNKKKLLEKVYLDKIALKEAEEELKKSSQEITEYIKRLEGNLNPSQNVGSLQWPTVGPVTSGFGMRWHPILHVYRMHTGIDIGAPYGQKIVAAQNGTVIFVGWKGGYGRTLMIAHGEQIITLYAHTSTIYVYEGQEVSKGQKVAAIGVTGYSTGPHLHFEVRVKGEPKNPMNWF